MKKIVIGGLGAVLVLVGASLASAQQIYGGSSSSVSYGSNVNVNIVVPSVNTNASEMRAAFEMYHMRELGARSSQREAHVAALQMMALQPRVINVSPSFHNDNRPTFSQRMRNNQHQQNSNTAEGGRFQVGPF